MSAPIESKADKSVKFAFTKGGLYDPARISQRLDSGGDDYADRLLQQRFQLVAEFYNGGRLVDLCCATGVHLLHLARGLDSAIGIDFSGRYLEQAQACVRADAPRNLAFVQADVRTLPLATASVDFLYCFSSLYAIPRAHEVLLEVGRVLAPGGRAVLDVGNKRSVNAYCLRFYPELPATQALTLGEVRRAMVQAGLETLRHRRFQLLPLWAGRPAWLWPILHPFWKSVLKRRVLGKMLDERLSSLPILRAFAFRHLIVCRKV